MAGPNVKLTVTGAGKATVDELNSSLDKLRQNLASMKDIRPDLGGLGQLTDEMRKFRTQFIELAQGQKTALAEMAEAIQSGMKKAAAAAKSGADQVEKELSKAGNGKSGISAFKAKLMVGSAGFEQAARDAAAREGNALASWQAKMQVGSLRITEAQNAAAERAAAGASAWQAKMQVGSLKIAESIAKADQTEASAKAAWVAKMQLGSLKISEAQDLAAAKAAAGASAWQAKMQVGSLKIAEALAASELKEERAKLAWVAKMQTGSLKIAEAQEAAAAKAAAGASAWQAKMQLGSLKIAESIQAAAAKEAEARAAWIAKMQVGSLKIAEEQAAAADREVAALKNAAEKIRVAEAAYQARNPRAQLGTAVRARAQLDAGRAPEDVSKTFGSTALSVAQAATSFDQLKASHASFNAELEAGKPKLANTKLLLNDLHSAARGAASGFNAMFLTWGNLGPLLAGAALSNAFVQVVKLGSAVEHELSIIQVLGGETAQSVAGLREQLLGLAREGPFGPQQIAEAFKSLTLAGLSIKEQRAAIGDVLNFAIAGTTTIEQAAESMVQMSTAFGYTANGFGRVGDIVSKAAAISLSSVESLTRSMQSASEVHVLYGASLVDVATNLAILSQLGIRGTAAGTALKNMYAELSGSTSIVRRNMVAWKVDALDPQTGKIKELLPLVESLAQKYNSLKGAAQTRFVQDLSNTRGGKDLVALLDAFNKKSKEGGDAVSQLQSTRQQIDQAYGYQAVAAAQLALTSKNQIASVASSFQASLVEAFSSIQPALFQITSGLQKIFGSREFQNNVTSLALTVANLGVVLVQNLDVVKNLAIAYLAWKAAAFTGDALRAGVGIITALTTSMRGLTVATVENTVATEANAAISSTVASTGLKRIAGLIPVIGTVLVGATVAWDLYWASARGDKKGPGQTDALAANQAVLAKLQEETKRARSNLLALQGKTAEEEFNKNQESGRASLQQLDDDIAAKQAAVDAAQTRLDQVMANVAKSRATGVTSGVETGAGGTARKALAAAQSNLNQATLLRSQINKELDANRQMNELVAQYADRQAKVKASEGTGERPVPEEAPGSLINSLKAQYSAREKTLKEAFANERAQLEESNKGKLISETTYALASEELAQRQYDAESKLLAEYVEKYRSKIVELQAAGKNGKANTVLTELAETQKQLTQELNQRKAIADIKSAGKQNVDTRAVDAELAKLREGVSLMEDQQRIKQAIDSMLPEEQAYAIARNAEAEKYSSILLKTQQQITDAYTDLDKLDTNEPLALRLRKRITELESELQRIQAERDRSADRAGSVARDAVMPDWKKNSAEWQNTLRTYRKAYDDMITGLVQRGEDLWVSFIETGKLNIQDMGKFIIAEISKTVYRTQIAPEATKLAENFSSFVFGRGGSKGSKPLEGASTTGDNGAFLGAYEDLAQKQLPEVTKGFNDLRASFAPVTDSLSKFGSSIWSAIQSIFSAIQSSSGSSIGGFFGSLFGGGSGGAGATGDMGSIGGAVGAAKGAAFNWDGWQKYAKGGIFDRPTGFKFANGAGFSNGVMGEAGPEAVMPLKRGPNGSLGVVMHGGAAPTVNANTYVSVQNQAGVEVQTRESRRPNGDKDVQIFLRQAKNQMIRDVKTGGAFASTLKSQGVSMRGGLPRRN
jgi:TP901 family phage tail tape measure protein